MQMRKKDKIIWKWNLKNSLKNYPKGKPVLKHSSAADSDTYLFSSESSPEII